MMIAAIVVGVILLILNAWIWRTYLSPIMK